MPQPTDPAPPPDRPIPSQEPVRRPRARSGWMLTGAAVVAGLAAAAGLYGMGGRGKEGPAACVGTAATIARLDPLVHGEVAAVGLSRAPMLFPDVTFQDGQGAPRSLADFRGKIVLLNLWATWCVPCRKEMPALDRLQGRLGGPDFQVVAINVDKAGVDRPKTFFTESAIAALPFYADSAGTVLPKLYKEAAVTGLPTTFLIDRNGCTVGTIAGGADWSSSDAQALIVGAKS